MNPRHQNKRHKTQAEHLINREIQAQYVLLIKNDSGEKEKLPFFVAYKKAKEMELDLVQVSPPHSQNAVCKIMDYKKYLYDKKKKKQLLKKNQKVVLTKEIQFRLNTDIHDYETKINHIKRFLAKEHKVKVIIFFRGREVNRNESATNMLNKIVERLQDISKQDSNIQEGKRTMFLILSPLPNDKKATDDKVSKKNEDSESKVSDSQSTSSEKV